jgi:hypothetical protein
MDEDLKYKVCINCGQNKTLIAENFYRRTKGSSDGFHNKCKQCMNDYFKIHRKTEAGLASDKRKKEKKKKQRQDFVKKLQIENKRQCTKCKEIFPLTEDHYKITVRQNKSIYSKKCIKCYINPHHIIEEGVEKKKCSTCDEWKPATKTYFHGDKGQTSGLYSVCKACKHKKSKAWKKTENGRLATSKWRRQKWANDPAFRAKQIESHKRYIKKKWGEGVSGVYEIINHANNKSYIGESKAINMRWQDHWRKLRRNRHENKKIQADYNLYGEENFEYKILLELPDDKDVRLLEEAKEIHNRLKAGQELYNLQLTIKQVKMLTEEK